MRKVFCEVTSSELELPDEVRKIVSLSPAATEALYLLGVGERVVGVSAFDVHPVEARAKPILGSYSTANIERLRTLAPDVVFLTTGYQRTLVEKLNRDFPVYALELPPTVASILTDVIKVGLVVNKVDEARSLYKRMLRRVSEIISDPVGTVYVEIDLGGPVTFGAYSYITDGLSLVGLKNIFGSDMVEWREPDFAKVKEANPDAIIYEPKMFKKVGVGKVYEILESRGWGTLEALSRKKVYVTPGPYDFLAHHGPGFVLEALPWLSRVASSLGQ